MPSEIKKKGKQKQTPVTSFTPEEAQAGAGYEFVGGYPTEATIKKAYDDADLNRALQAYRFFYPTVSGAAIVKGTRDIGLFPNKVFGKIDTQPKHLAFTLNSDTPYGPAIIDLSISPYVVEIPPGPLFVSVLDINQRWIADMGMSGPGAGHGGRHLLLPPGYAGRIPEGYFIWKASSNILLMGVRSLPVEGDVKGALDRLSTIKVYPLNPTYGRNEPIWIELTEQPLNITPLEWEDNIRYWEALHEVINTEHAYEEFKLYYGELAALGIVKGKPFHPDARMKRILEQAARLGNMQMRVQAFADRREDRAVWPDRKWEWVALRFENAEFATPDYIDVSAREVWFYQATGASPSMFRRQAGSGSLYWLGLRDNTGAYLDGGKTYKLAIPQPVPAKLFWSVTVYDAETRSQIQTTQGKAALRSLFELKNLPPDFPVELFFGPAAPPGKERQWIKTLPGKGWFVYFRIYGPKPPAFDGSWKPGDFEEVK